MRSPLVIGTEVWVFGTSVPVPVSREVADLGSMQISGDVWIDKYDRVFRMSDEGRTWWRTEEDARDYDRCGHV